MTLYMEQWLRLLGGIDTVVPGIRAVGVVGSRARRGGLGT